MIPKKPTILIIDDDEQIRLLLMRLLAGHNDCTVVESAESALALLDEKKFDLIISDINMSGISGLELVPTILQKDADAVVVMVSGQQTIEYAIEAMRVGAFDYITKPVNIDHIEAAVRRALSHHTLLEEKRRYENHLEEMVRERTAELEYLAYHDRLTDLPNRNLFVDRCNEAIVNAKANGHLATVMLVSLDRFKNINDTLGHEAGDQLLKNVAARLRAILDGQGTAARFEGADFGVLLNTMTDSVQTEEVCQSIRNIFKKSFAVGNQEVYLTASMGISVSSDSANGASSILQNAGAALRRARTIGGNNYQFYTADMNATSLKRLSLETSLRHAIDNEEFVTFYQPVVDLSSGDIVGFEALVRWQHPELGLLAPIEFLDLAESTGLIVEISESVMRTACRQTWQWQKQGRKNLRIAVNISARHFRQKDFVGRIVQIVAASQLDPRSLELELTESSIMENPEAAAEVLSEIRALGIAIAIDDFGTGYSSMSYLKLFSVNTLKVDRSFVSGVATDPHNAAMVRAMVTLAHDLNLRVVAEGIESESELLFLKQLSCDEGQGYFFSKPQPAIVVESLLFPAPIIRSNALRLSTAVRNAPILPTH
ncbi:MAG TPA: EAL domain-containing protein [Pyrinomonadaceae bacterium]|jgi:diguanylate cyclase (GGDEF)-like protein|nr:EAL domain-containing protein [Pyrinomonadaceae bacterium]